MRSTVLLILLLVFGSNSAIASSKTPGKVVAGYIEKVVIENQKFSTKAKLDTGAKTSSIYAENIEKFKVGKERWVRFTLVLDDVKNIKHKITLERKRARRVKIKNHDAYPDLCQKFKPCESVCGGNQEQALKLISDLEQQTNP